MVIAAWIVFISVIILMLAHIILLIVNKKYRKKIISICGIIVTIVLLPILFYTIGTSLLIMIHGDCFVAYYNPGGNEMFYYNDYEYYLVEDIGQAREIMQYGGWTDTNLYISSDPIAFPYLEYWWPKVYTDELVLPGDLEPIYIRVAQWDGSKYYVREDVREEMR